MTSTVDRLVDSVRALPSIPQALQEVLDTLNNEEANVNDIVEPLSRDMALTLKVLRMANAAHFGLQKQVASIDDAIHLVGLNAVRTMVISSGLMGAFDDIPGFDMKRFWRLSLLSALIGRDIAKQCAAHPEQAYTATLMHGLGVLALHRAFPEECQQIDRKCHDITPQDRALCEMDGIGIHHGLVGAEIAKKWNLPEAVAQAIKDYAFPELQSTKMSLIAFVATAFAIDLEDKKDTDDLGSGVAPYVYSGLGCHREQLLNMAERWTDYRTSTDLLVS
ncbi:MAG TPA: HDOD domain-containing protein [Limnobacter sp.]|nr:HDOD domain-containing protein [Limnobacter sp.]